jgi:hypothetical protein
VLVLVLVLVGVPLLVLLSVLLLSARGGECTADPLHSKSQAEADNFVHIRAPGTHIAGVSHQVKPEAGDRPDAAQGRDDVKVAHVEDQADGSPKAPPVPSYHLQG